MEEFYPKTLNIYMYFPKYRERHDEWGAISYSNAKFRKGITTNNADFLGLFVHAIPLSVKKLILKSPYSDLMKI